MNIKVCLQILPPIHVSLLVKTDKISLSVEFHDDVCGCKNYDFSRYD
jgi:hypothetical protein